MVPGSDSIAFFVVIGLPEDTDLARLEAPVLCLGADEAAGVLAWEVAVL